MREYHTARYIRAKRTGRIVAQMKFRARDFHRILSLSLPPPHPSLSSISSSFFFCQLLLFRPVDRTRPRQRRAFSVGEARPTLRRRIFKREENSLCIQPSLFRPRAEGGTRGWQCGLFAEKSHSRREPQLRASHCLRGGGPEQNTARGEEGDRRGGGEQKAPSTHAPNFGKHLADSRRSFSPFPLVLDSARKSSRRAL